MLDKCAIKLSVLGLTVARVTKTGTIHVYGPQIVSMCVCDFMHGV